jgi:hypothetical protein
MRLPNNLSTGRRPCAQGGGRGGQTGVDRVRQFWGGLSQSIYAHQLGEPGLFDGLDGVRLEPSEVQLQGGLSQSIYGHQLGTPGLFPAPKLTDWCREPRMST